MSGNSRPPRPGGGERKSAKTPSSRGATARKWLFRLTAAGLVCLLVAVGVFYFAYRSTTIPSPNQAFRSQTTSVYYAGGKDELGRFAIQNRESIPLADVPQVMQDAIIAAEDRTFWTNNGIDPKGILRAAFSNAQGNATQGASTITQQYVKILYLTQERTLKRKIKEAFLSLKVQQEQSKSAILEGYLNTIYFGRGAYGIQAAAKAYFDRPAKRLRLSQAAMLAAVVNSPNYLSPDRNKASRAALLERYQYVLNGMVKAGAVDSARADAVINRLPKMVKPNRDDQFGEQRGFMLSMVKDELLKLGFDENEIEGGGLKVTTTFTRKAMKADKDAVLAVRPKGLKGLHVGVASVDVKSGGLLGIYGGQDYLKSQLNWAKATDSPGSAFKPFALAAGIKDGFNLKSTFDGNSPYEFPDGSTVVNEGEGGGEDYGSAVSLIKATADSINTAFIDMTMSMDNGPKKIRDMAVKMGIPDRKALEANAGISLGSAPQSPIEMANAYATIANGGVQHNWYVVQKVVRKSDGKTLWEAPRKKNRALSADIASDVSYAMQQVVEDGTGNRALALGRPAAGKTGTATDDEGNVITSWFAGFTPQVSTAVMYVRGNGRKPLQDWLPPYNGSTGYFGANYPTMTWTVAMQGIMDGMDVEDFPEPAFVTGEPPSTGHAPYTPPPPPPKKTKKTKPKPKPTKTTSAAPVDACPGIPGNQAPGTDCAPPPPPPTSSCDISNPDFPNCSPSGSPSPTANERLSPAARETWS